MFRSSFIFWTKLALLFASAGLLSAIFIMSRTGVSTGENYFGEIDLEKHSYEQIVTRPFFAGVTENSDQIGIRSSTARPIKNDLNHLHAENIDAEIALSSGSKIYVTALYANVHVAESSAVLNDDVYITTTTGYHLSTEHLKTRFDILYAESPGPVSGRGLHGDLTASSMLLAPDKDTGVAHLVFRGDVKLIYQPQTVDTE